MLSARETWPPPPSPLHGHPCPRQIPPDLSRGWLTLGGARLPWQVVGCAARVPVPQTCPSRLLHPAQPSPAQPSLGSCQGSRIALGSGGPILRANPLLPRDFKGFRAQWTLWAFLSQHRPPAPLPAEAWPCCVLLPRTLWILFALSLGRPGLVFGELFPAAAPAPHRFLLRPASSNHRLS